MNADELGERISLEFSFEELCFLEWAMDFLEGGPFDSEKEKQRDEIAFKVRKTLSDYGDSIIYSAPLYIDLERLNELQSISSPKFDLTKLITLCKEININFANGCYLAITMLLRAILDHIPPIFGFRTFNEVANNYGGKSFKQSMQNLQNSSRNITDAYLHLLIRDKETLPNKTQVNFSNDLDVLLAEIVRVLK